MVGCTENVFLASVLSEQGLLILILILRLRLFPTGPDLAFLPSWVE